MNLPWKVRPGTLVIEDSRGCVVATVRSGQDWRRNEPRPKDLISRQDAEAHAQLIVESVNARASKPRPWTEALLEAWAKSPLNPERTKYPPPQYGGPFRAGWDAAGANLQQARRSTSEHPYSQACGCEACRKLEDEAGISFD